VRLFVTENAAKRHFSFGIRRKKLLFLVWAWAPSRWRQSEDKLDWERDAFCKRGESFAARLLFIRALPFVSLPLFAVLVFLLLLLMAFKAPLPLIRRSTRDFLHRSVLGNVFVQVELLAPQIKSDYLEICLHFKDI
jgi:hypothetical protein